MSVASGAAKRVFQVSKIAPRNSALHLKRLLANEQRSRRQAEIALAAKSQELESAQSTLREQLERSRAVLQHAAEGILTFSGDGFVTSFNPAAERIFGYEVTAAIGLRYEELLSVPGTNTATFDQWVDFLMSDRHARQCSHALGIHRNGTSFPMDIVASRVQLGNRTLVTAIVRDTTQRLELERQLAHAQKMESIGQLAAGIAHEINTPIQYVGDNCRFLQEAFDDLNSLLQAYLDLDAAAADGLPTSAFIRNIADLIAGTDLQFLRKEIPNAISQSIDGTDRVAQIVRAMKNFSHPGNREKTPSNLNDCIESTITVCRNEWKYVAQIKTDLDPHLPLLPCFPGELNQVFLNLITNSAHAIKEKQGIHSRQKGTIKISSRTDRDSIELLFSDNGTGIPQEIRGKIFDPFFTTKGVGRGTGQGLSICYSAIVDNHQGEIRFESEVGQGTTFTIRLPVAVEVTRSAEERAS